MIHREERERESSVLLRNSTNTQRERKESETDLMQREIQVSDIPRLNALRERDSGCERSIRMLVE